MRHAYEQDALAGAIFCTRAVSSAPTRGVQNLHRKYAKKKTSNCGNMHFVGVFFKKLFTFSKFFERGGGWWTDDNVPLARDGSGTHLMLRN